MEGKKTRVVRIRRKGGVVVQDCDVYIGRRMTQGGWNLKDSMFMNPFKVEKDRQKCIENYRNYLHENLQKDPGKWLMAILDLYGKSLGCWCKPEACHGDVLVEYAEKLQDILGNNERAEAKRKLDEFIYGKKAEEKGE